jgi:hypothetical protein
MESQLRAVFGWFGWFGPLPFVAPATRGRGRGWRVPAGLSSVGSAGSDSSDPFLSSLPRREEGAGDGESTPDLARMVRLVRIVRTPSFRRPATRGRGRGWRVSSGLCSVGSEVRLVRECGAISPEFVVLSSSLALRTPATRGRGRGWRVRSGLSSVGSDHGSGRTPGQTEPPKRSPEDGERRLDCSLW